MKKYLAILMAIILSLNIIACTQKDTENKAQEETKSDTSKSEENSAEVNDVKTDSGKHYKDEKQMVDIRVEDDKISMAIDISKWPVISGVNDEKALKNNKFLTKDKFIDVEDSYIKIKDVLIVEIPQFTLTKLYEDIALPIAFFLLEDGTVSWIVIDPMAFRENLKEEEKLEFLLQNQIAWIEDIEKLTYGDVAEGKGDEMTVFAEKADNTRYDLTIAISMSVLFANGNWKCDLPGVEDNLYMDFNDDKDMNLVVGKSYTESYASYSGEYRVYLAEDGKDGNRADTLSVALKLESTDLKTNVPKTIDSIFFYSTVDGNDFTLYPGDGDALYKNVGMPIEEYLFRIRNNL